MTIPTRAEALQFMEDSRRTVTPPTDAARVAEFRRQNVREKWVPQNLGDDEMLAILQRVDQLLIDPTRTR